MGTASAHSPEASVDANPSHSDEACSTHDLKKRSKAIIMIKVLLESAHNPQPSLSINESSNQFVRLLDITTFDLTKLFSSAEPHIHVSDFVNESTVDRKYSLIGAFMRTDEEAIVVVEGEEYQAQKETNTRKLSTTKPNRKSPVHRKRTGSPTTEPLKGIPQAILDLCHQIRGCRVNKDGLPVRKALKDQMPDHFLGSHRLLNHESPLFP